MDASKDSMNTTYQYLMRNQVKGTSVLPFDQLMELIDARVAIASVFLRQLTLSTIESQIVFQTKLSNDFGQKRALKVYSFGEEAWGDAETVQYWFVDRDSRWFWVKFDAKGGRQDYAEVSAAHLAETQRVPGSPDLAHITCLSSINGSFREVFKQAANSARLREEKMRTAVSRMTIFDTALDAVIS